MGMVRRRRASAEVVTFRDTGEAECMGKVTGGIGDHPLTMVVSV